MNIALRRAKQKIKMHPPNLRYGRARLTPLLELSKQDWKRIEVHFRDPEIAWLNGTPPNRMPLWILKRILKADSRRKDRETFGVFDEHNVYIGTIELYDIRFDRATLGIIIGERSHWSKGYGPEAINALLEFAFLDLDLRRVVLNTFADNPRAKASFTKIGFSETKRSQNYQNRINVHMQLNKNHWLELRRLASQTKSEEPVT